MIRRVAPLASNCQLRYAPCQALPVSLIRFGTNRWLTAGAVGSRDQSSADKEASRVRGRRGSRRARVAKQDEWTATAERPGGSFLASHAGADLAQRVRVFWDVENDLLNAPKFILSAKRLPRERMMLKKKEAALRDYAGAAELLEIQTFCGGVGSMKRTSPGKLALRCIRCRELCPEAVSVPGCDADTAMIAAMAALAADKTALPGVVVCVSGDGGFAGALHQLRVASHFIVVVSNSPSKLLRGVADLIHPQKLTASGYINTNY